MPIEVQIEKSHGKHMPAAETQRLARAYANEQIARQKADFQRLGVLGDWDHPYTTMAFKNEADEIRTLGQAPREGLPLSRPEAGQLVLRLRQRAGRGRSRVRGPRRHRDRRRRFRSTDADRGQARRGVRPAALPAGPGAGGDLDDDAVDDPGQPGAERASGFHLCAGGNAARASRARAGSASKRASRASSSKAASSRPPRARRSSCIRSAIRSTTGASPVYLGDYVTLEQGTGIVHFVAGVRHRGLPVVPPLRHEGRGDPQPGAGRRPLRRQPAVLRRREDLGGQSADRRQAARGRRAASRRRSTRTATCTAGGTRRRSSIARRRSGSPAWTTCRAGTAGSRPRRCARRRCAASRHTRFYPGWGKARLYGDDRQPAGLDAVAAAAVGRADAVLRRTRRPSELHPRTLELLEQVAATSREGRHRGVVDARRARTSASDPGEVPRRSTTRSTSGSTRAPRTRRCWADPKGATHGCGSHARDTASRRTSISKAPTSIAAGSIRRCSSRACSTACRRTRRCSPTASRSTARAGRCRSRRATCVAPQKVSDTLGAEILRLWVARHRLLGRALDLRRDPEARRRELSPHPQHAALPAGEHRRLRCRRRTRCRSTELLEIDRYALAAARALADGVPRPTTRATSSTSSCSGCRRSARRTSAASTSTC